MLTGAVQVRSYPYYMTIDPADACQLRCPTCPTGIENELKRTSGPDTVVYRKNRSVLSTERFEAVLDELGEYLFLILFYDYGEPLLNRELPRLIRRAKQFDIEIDVNTNLSLHLSDRYIEDLLSSGLDYLYCSVDGFTQKSYETHRVGGNLALVKNNLKRLAQARDRLGLKTSITYNFLVFSFNEHERPAARQYCRDLGINFNTREAIIHRPDWLPTYRKNDEPVAIDDDRWSTFRLPDSFSHTDGDRGLVWLPIPEVDGATRPRACAWHYGYSVMTAGGAVAPCCAVPHEEDDFGNFVPGRVRFAEIWNNDRYRSSRAAFAGADSTPRTETICTHCPLPTFMHDMYSPHDVKVLRQGHCVFDQSDPVLAKALRCLADTRYGPLARGLYGREVSFRRLQQQFGMSGHGPDMTSFVQFCEDNLVEHFSAVVDGRGGS